MSACVSCGTLALIGNKCNVCWCAELVRERTDMVAEADAYDEAKEYDERNGKPGERAHDRRAQ